MKNRLWIAPMAGVFANNFVGEGKPVDVKLGMALLRDRRVPVASKLLSVVGGIGLVALLEAFEIPAELLLSFLLPFIGLGINMVMDGVEAVLGSFLFAATLLPFLAPREIVAQIRMERLGQLEPVRVTVTER